MDPPEEQPFRFLDLPREMRDNVYDLLIIGNETSFHKGYGEMRFVGQNYSPTNALLVNHQINQEIKRRSNIFPPKLSLTDEEYFDYLHTPSLILPPITKIVRIRLFAICKMPDTHCTHRKSDPHCIISLMMSNHFEWIQSWLALAPGPYNFVIDAQIFLGAETVFGGLQSDTIEESGAPWQVGRFTQLPALRKVQVYTGADTSYDPSFFAEEYYFITWMKEKGWGRNQDEKVTESITDSAEPWKILPA